MTAGSISVPTIVPLRPPVLGKLKTSIDSNTKIELRTSTEDAVIHYTLNGSKPDPFQRVGEKCTMQYRGPFTLPAGRRTIKAIAFSKDGMRESHPVTKTFEVAYVEPPLEGPVDDEHGFQDDLNEELVKLHTKRAAKDLMLSSKSAWADVSAMKSASQMIADMNITGNDKLQGRSETRFLNNRNRRGRSPDRQAVDSNKRYQERRMLPDSSAQLDRLQRETDVMKYLNNGTYVDPYIDTHSNFHRNAHSPVRTSPHKAGKMGSCIYCKSIVPFNTTSCVVCEGPIPVDVQPLSVPAVPQFDLTRLAIPPPEIANISSSAFLRPSCSVATQTVGLFYPSTREMNKKQEAEEEKVAYEKQMRDRRPLLTAVSPGKGYWRRQLDHICQHLKAHGQNNAEFRALIGEPKMGKLITSSVQEDGHELNLTLTFAIRGKKDPLTGKKIGLSGDYLSFHTERDSYASDYTESEEEEIVTPHSHRKKTVKKTKVKRKNVPKISPLDIKLLKQLGHSGEGEPAEVQQLIDEGADPNCTDKNGLPVLHVAVKHRHYECIPILYQAGADMNKKGPSAIKGNTALHEAVSLGSGGLDVIDNLLKCGADQYKKNDKGETPLDLAIKSGYESIATRFASALGQSQLEKMLKTKTTKTQLVGEVY